MKKEESLPLTTGSNKGNRTEKRMSQQKVAE
jgi:hypothetical protein